MASQSTQGSRSLDEVSRQGNEAAILINEKTKTKN
jgi:hypothetical protein